MQSVFLGKTSSNFRKKCCKTSTICRSVILSHHVFHYTAKFAQVAAGLLSACCEMSSIGRMSDAFARHVAACRHMPATDCRQICCKLLRQNCSSAFGNRPAASCCDRTAAMLLLYKEHSLDRLVRILKNFN